MPDPAPQTPDDEIGAITAAAAVGVSASHLRRLDDVLCPRRDHLGRRVYSRAAIDAFAGERDAKRAELARRHAATEREHAAALTDRAERRERLADQIDKERGR